MGVYLELVDNDELFHKSTKSIPVVINNLSETSARDKENLNNLISTKYANSNDLMSNEPRCECGATTGEYKKDTICDTCNYPVVSPIEQDLEPLVWIAAPEGVEALINLNVLTMLRKKFLKKNFDVIRWIVDRNYTPTVKKIDVLNKLEQQGVGRGYNNFVKNFDSIMNILFNMKEYSGKRGVKDPYQLFLEDNRHRIFSKYMPIVNRSLLVIEETNNGRYVDPLIVDAIDAIRNMVGIDSPLSTHSQQVKENRTIKSLLILADFQDGSYSSVLAGKPGAFRKHKFGTRAHFSFRTVISSMTGPHDYDELHIPWSVAVTVFDIHLKNKLLRMGYTPNSAKGFLNQHAYRYSPILEGLFKELIAESPHNGIRCVFQRNPSLERASAQAFRITRVKTDLNDTTVSLSILAVVGFNAD